MKRSPLRIAASLTFSALLLAGHAAAQSAGTGATGPAVLQGPDLALATNRAAQQAETGAFDPGRVGFEVEVQGLNTNLERFFAIALPGEVVTIDVAARPDSPAFRFDSPGVERTVEGPQAVAVKAPAKPGAYPITITGPAGEVMTLTLFTLVPATQVEDGSLNGYRIGHYPDRPLKGLESYLPPTGFISMPPALYDYPLSPHFTLGQFVSKQSGDAPVKYLVVKPELVKKLERLLMQVNEEGIRADSFYVMSGYRTPFYNAAIGNVRYSRHQWGDAADIYVDRAPQDEIMDDIDESGAVTRADAGRLYDLAEDVDNLTELKPLRGGVGEYGANAAHGPFVHVDTRGTPARWGR